MESVTKEVLERLLNKNAYFMLAFFKDALSTCTRIESQEIYTVQIMGVNITIQNANPDPIWAGVKAP